jgi:excinuclease ABC subunit B
LIQTIGRAARNVNGMVILYADSVTDSMRRAIEETDRRRRAQAQFNKEHGITPQTIVKAIGTRLVDLYEADYVTVPLAAEKAAEYIDLNAIPRKIQNLRKQMKKAAQELDFERAAKLRDEIKLLEEKELGLKNPLIVRGADR